MVGHVCLQFIDTAGEAGAARAAGYHLASLFKPDFVSTNSTSGDVKGDSQDTSLGIAVPHLFTLLASTATLMSCSKLTYRVFFHCLLKVCLAERRCIVNSVVLEILHMNTDASYR